MPDYKVLRCECGHEVPTGDEAQLVEAIRLHARNAHGIAFSVEDALLVVLRSQLDVSLGRVTTDTRASCVSRNQGGER